MSMYTQQHRPLQVNQLHCRLYASSGYYLTFKELASLQYVITCMRGRSRGVLCTKQKLSAVFSLTFCSYFPSAINHIYFSCFDLFLPCSLLSWYMVFSVFHCIATQNQIMLVFYMGLPRYPMLISRTKAANQATALELHTLHIELYAFAHCKHCIH